MEERKKGSGGVVVDSRYFVETMKAVRAAIRDLRKTLDELEAQCDSVCDRAVPELLSEMERVYAEK